MALFNNNGGGFGGVARDIQDGVEQWRNLISQPEHQPVTDEQLKNLRQYEIDKLKAGRGNNPVQNQPANNAPIGRPVISNNYINYYTTNINPSYGQPVVLPVPPDSRLQPIGVVPDSYPFADKKQPVITIERSIAERQWGGLLHEPLSGNSVSIKTFDTRNIDAAIVKANDRSLVNLNKWIKDGGDIDQNDLSLLFLDKLNIETGKVMRSVAYGSDAISYLYASFHARSLNTGDPAITTVTKQVTYKKDKSVIPEIIKKDIGYGFIPGGDSFEPIEVPETLTNPDKIKPKTLKNAGQGVAYLIQIIDELVGQFPLKIKIEDSNISQGGNQGIEIEIPNLSEGIAEIFGLVFNNNQHGQLSTILGTHNLTLATQGLISSNITQDVSLAIADYLGFKMGQVKRKIKLPVDPTKGKISEILKGNEMEYPSYDMQDEHNMQLNLVRYDEAASIVKAALFKRFNINNLENEINDYLKALKIGDSNLSDTKWREFLEQVELGFQNYKTQGGDTPYQNNYEQRPLIRDLTNGDKTI